MGFQESDFSSCQFSQAFEDRHFRKRGISPRSRVTNIASLGNDAGMTTCSSSGQLIEKEIKRGNSAVPGNDEISPGVSRLSPAAEKFWQCAKEAASRK
jgi:hypothetical protein